jgi:hypothetical protein
MAGVDLQPGLTDLAASSPSADVTRRATQTLALMHRWGYAPSVETLATELVGGTVPPSHILSSVDESSAMDLRDGFVYLEGNERLVAKSRARVTSHRVFNGEALLIAAEFARELVRDCPVVDCVALSGSAASGGYARGDDIDFDLFTRDGTKYLVYGVALALGLKFALRRWRSRGFRKLICINVIWTRSESRPFARQDEGLAFELLRCQPLVGGEVFRDVLGANGWTVQYFPQLHQKVLLENGRPSSSRIGHLISNLTRHPGLMAAANRTSRIVTRAAYEIAHLLRGRDPIALARIQFLQRVKYPYEVFQD